ncbi:MAG: 16S rRNA (guanine(966)-N(2))-methyltransferase RsmD [Acidobacteriaceae bacterium]
MRVIAGSYRSRPLTAPTGKLTRPTSDRLRETLFNILAPRVAGSRFADLFAGTGAVGIEALSRGAKHVLFAEQAPPALAALRANLHNLKITGGFTIEARRTTAALDRILDRWHASVPPAHNDATSTAPVAPVFDLVFLDPPYEAALEYVSTLSLLGGARSHLLLAPGVIVVAEHSSKSPLPESFGCLRQFRTLKQGDAALTFFAR